MRFRGGRSITLLATTGVFTLGAVPALAQSDVLLQLESGSPASDRFVVDSAGGFVALGMAGRGTNPASGPGTRLVWYPGRAALRAGYVTGTEWDDAGVGSISTATGHNTIASGLGSTALGGHTVAGGAYSTATGYGTRASGAFSTAIGESTTASGESSTAIGLFTTAAGRGTTALGVRARAGHAGSFVWGSTNTSGNVPGDSITSTAVGQFSVRAVGGVRMFTDQAMSAGMTMGPGASTWSAVSDRDRKENFAPVDGEDVLRRLRQVPVTSWNYIAEGREVRHIGPMAQEWHAAFPLNDDPLTINQGDFDGVNLAAIRALDARTRNVPELERELARLRAENEALRHRLQAIESLLADR
jgi:trimeric autotransporter adhesin